MGKKSWTSGDPNPYDLMDDLGTWVEEDRRHEEKASRALEERILKSTPDDARALARKIINGEY